MSDGDGKKKQVKEDNALPKLRFPEFKDVGEWDRKRMKDVAPLQRGFDLPTSQLQKGNIPVVYSNGIRNFHSIGMAKAPGLVTGRSGTIGQFHFVEEGDYWPHNTSLWVTSFKGNLPKFIYYLYKSLRITRFESGSGVPTLNRNDVHSFKVGIPRSIEEQQKIADCLSSIDDRITAETQKLDTLKAHKKGLMQQLFPAEGESVPKRRFRKFKKQWGETVLSKFINLQSGYAFKSEYFSEKGEKLLIPKNFTKTGYAHFSDENTKYTTEEYDARYVCRKGDLLLLLTDLTPSCELLGRPLLLTESDGNVLLNQRIARVIVKKEINLRFLLYLFSTASFRKRIINTATGSTVRHSSNKIVLSTKIRIPEIPDEQQEVADCLSVLDEVIAAQTQKLTKLKYHKKGLMQQLFPSLDEAKR